MNKIFIPLVVIVGLLLLCVLIFNLSKKNKIVKYVFILFIIALFIVFDRVNNAALNSILYFIIRYLDYPEIDYYNVTLGITLIILVYTIFNENIKDKEKIINYIFSILIITSYVIFTINKYDVNSYNVIYKGMPLHLLRYLTKTFTLWIITNISIGYYKFITKKLKV